MATTRVVLQSGRHLRTTLPTRTRFTCRIHRRKRLPCTSQSKSPRTACTPFCSKGILNLGAASMTLQRRCPTPSSRLTGATSTCELCSFSSTVLSIFDGIVCFVLCESIPHVRHANGHTSVVTVAAGMAGRSGRFICRCTLLQYRMRTKCCCCCILMGISPIRMGSRVNPSLHPLALFDRSSYRSLID